MNQTEKMLQRDIYNIVNEIKKCKNDYQFLRLINSYHNLVNIIEDTNANINYPKESEFELNKVSCDKISNDCTKMYIDQLDKMEKINNGLLKIYKHIVNRYDLPGRDLIFEVGLDMEEVKSLVADFFKQYDEDIYNKYLKMLSSPRIIKKEINDNAVGFCNNPNHVVDSYIIMSPFENIVDVQTLAHEFIHVYFNNDLKYYSLKDYKNYFVNNNYEVYSIFIELLVLDYLREIRMPKNDIDNALKIHNYELIGVLKEYNDITVENFSINDYRKAELYSYGYVLAYHFYDQYLKDKEKAKYNIKEFMKNLTKHDKVYLLNHYGLNQNDVINPQKLTKHIDKSLRGQRK